MADTETAAQTAMETHVFDTSSFPKGADIHREQACRVYRLRMLVDALEERQLKEQARDFDGLYPEDAE